MLLSLEVITRIAGVVGLVIMVLFFIYRQISAKDIYSKLTGDQTHSFLRTMIILVFWTVVVIAGYSLGSKYLDNIFLLSPNINPIPKEDPTPSISRVEPSGVLAEPNAATTRPLPPIKSDPEPVCPEKNCFFVEQDTACRSDAFVKQHMSKQGLRLFNTKSSHIPIVSLICNKDIVNLDGSLPEELGERIVKLSIGISINMDGETLFYDPNFYNNKRVYLGTEKEAIAVTLRNFSSTLQTKLKLQALKERI